VLAQREGIKPDNVKRSVGAWSPEFSSNHVETQRIASWAERAGLSAVVWTALQPRFAGRSIKPSMEQVINHLTNLDPKAKRLAEEYVRRAPPQIRTAYREGIQRHLGWALSQELVG